MLGRGVEPIALASVREATAYLAAVGCPDGAIVDVMLPDGSGLDFVARLRERTQTAPILVCTGYAAPAISRQAYLLRAALLLKPTGDEPLHAFARAVELARLERGRDDAVIERLASEVGLSAVQTGLLGLLARGHTQQEIAGRLGVSLRTLKRRVAAVRRRTGHRRASQLVGALRAG